MIILEIMLGAALLSWFTLAIFLVWATRGSTILRPGQEVSFPHCPPKVSILVPARNEEGALPEALQSFVALDYADFEVILVNDGSTDSTGRIADEWAAKPASRGRVRVVHNNELPEGWAGKVHALSLAARLANGEWILATDADVVFQPGLLKLAVSLALEKNAQLVSLMPEIQVGGFWEKVVLPAFSLLLTSIFPPRLVNHPGCPRAIAAGAFILMRRRDLEDLGGYAAIKNVVIEDLRMAELFKKNGRRIHLAASRGLFHTKMYSGVNEMWEGLSRSAFEGVTYSVTKVLGGVTIGIWVGVLPWVAAVLLLFQRLHLGNSPDGQIALALALATCLESVLIYLPVMLFFRVPVIYVFTLPLAALFYSGVSLNSMLRSLFGSGVAWKGRNYRPSR